MDVRWAPTVDAKGFHAWRDDTDTVAAVVYPAKDYPGRWEWIASRDQWFSTDTGRAENVEHAFLQAENSLNGWGGTW